MKLSDSTYTWMKWLTLVVIPALTTAYVGLDSVFNWGYGDVVAKVSSILCALLGTLLGISTAEYRRGEQEPAVFDLKTLGKDSGDGEDSSLRSE